MAELPNLSGLKLGNYRLERMLGRGRMGVVYLAKDEALLRPTAVKILSWSGVEPGAGDPDAWFLAEARSVAQLHHPAIVQVYGVARHGPYRYIAMEYVEGVSADVLLAERGPLPADLATAVLAQIAAALSLAHSSHLVHRDVKPANVLIKRDHTAKLGDFGMALDLRAGPADIGARVGTPYYIAPEVWRGEASSPASDIYALGATYFSLLTGRPPFVTPDLAALSAAHQRAEIPAPQELVPGVPEGCARIVRRCLAKSPQERYASAQEVEWDARGLLRTLEGAAPPPSPRPALPAAPPERLSFREASGEWAALGFELEPFGAVDPARCPYGGEPFAGALHELQERLAAGGGSVVTLTGAAASGRSLLARRLYADPAGHASCAYLDLAGAAPGRRDLLGRVARLFGALPKASSGGDAEIDGLLDQLQQARETQPALVILDGLAATAAILDALAALARAARSTTYFSLLLVGPPELAGALAASSDAAAVALPPLTPAQTRGYVDGWLRATRPRGAAPLIITPDAALLAGQLAGGDLHRLNRIAAVMVRHAAGDGRGVVSSWDAWAAAQGDGVGDRPEVWPSPEVLAILNRCRVEAGLPERG